MRIVPLALAGACASALVVVWVVRAGKPATRTASAPITESVPAVPAAIAPESATPAAPRIDPVSAPRVDVAREAAAIPPVSAPITSSSPRARVFGRLMDEERHPAADVTLRLTASGKEWAKGETVPMLTFRTWQIPGFETKSGADGRFDFDVPVPTADWISLHTDAPPYLGIVGKEFGPAGGRDQPRIVAGDNDVGDLVLTITGAVSGDVRSIDGAGIAKAEVRLDGAFPGGFGVGTECDDAGHFVLGHVPAGKWNVEALAEGFLSASIQGIEVTARSTTPTTGFRLERGPTISGRVVDEDGKPIDKALIAGWPITAGQGADAFSKADGTFVMHLPQNEPYTLEIDERWNRGRYEPWGGRATQKGYEPGTNDVLVKLVRVPRTTFLVVDTDGKPIEDYAIGIADRPDADGNVLHGGLRETVKIEHHEHGETTLPADPKRHRVEVVAPGFVDLDVDVAGEATQDGARQTLNMKPGGAFTGRVMHAGTPVPGTRLELDRDSFKIDPSKPDEEDSMFDENYTTDLNEFLGRARRIEGRGDGTFRIADLPAGTYRLEIRGGNGAPKIVRGLRLEAGATRDLGEIGLDDAGRVHGHVVLGLGQEQMEIGLLLDDAWGRPEAPAGLERSFAYDNLVVGDHVLHASMAATGFRDQIDTHFVVAAGKTTEIVIDLSTKAPCRTHIRVVNHGRPMPGVKVGWQSIVDGRPAANGQLGTSDEDGRASGAIPGGTRAVFVADSPAGFVIGRSTEPVLLAPASLHEADLEVRSGVLVLELPATIELPSDGLLSVALRNGDDMQSAMLCTPKSRMQMGLPLWTGAHCVIGPVAPGEYTIFVHAQKLEDMTRYVPLIQAFTSKLTVKEGETVTLAVHE